MSIKSQTKKIVSAADVASDITSEVIDLRLNYGVFIQATFTGAPSGSIVLQASNDKTTWTTLDSVTISSTTPLSINKDAIHAPYLRVYKGSGGTGSCTVTLTLKGV